MVDNERLDAKQAEDDVKEIPLACCSSSGFACTQGQSEQLGVTDTAARHDGGRVIDDEDGKSRDTSDLLRHIVIDGSNIAMSHGNRTTFSCRGIKLAVEWFRQRGHTNITVFVPQWRRETHKQECTVTDPEIMFELEREKVLVFTPSRKVGGKRIVCYDDRYIVKLAAETNGIMVSNDTYRDLAAENPNYRKAIDERLLMYSFVNDRFMPPDDPLGRLGPSLGDFLRKEPVVTEPRPPNCPYAKCTFGAKCRFYHPERVSSCNRPSASFGIGDKLSGPAVDSPGNSATPYRKKKLARGQRSYEKPKSENKHSHLKPFHSDPTCGHLALAKELSHEYKPISRHIPESNVAGKGHDSVQYSKDLPSTQDDDNGHKSENFHQRLRRQLAIQDNNDPRAANLGKTHSVNYVAESVPELDPDCASEYQSVNLPSSLSDVSPLISRNSCTDTANGTRLDTDRSSSRASRSHQTELELQQRTFCNDPQQFVVTGRNSQDHVPGGRLASPFMPPTSAYVDNMYLVHPVVSPYDYTPNLHSYRQLRAPQLVPRIHLSPSWPQQLVHQPRPFVPQNGQTRHFAVAQHHFVRR